MSRREEVRAAAWKHAPPGAPLIAVLATPEGWRSFCGFAERFNPEDADRERVTLAVFSAEEGEVTLVIPPTAVEVGSEEEAEIAALAAAARQWLAVYI